MNFKDYFKKKLGEEAAAEADRKKKDAIVQRKSRKHFKKLISKFDEILQSGNYESNCWCKYGMQGADIYKDGKCWLSIFRTINRRPLFEESLFITEYDTETGKESYTYHQNIYDCPFMWWQVLKTNNEVRLLIDFIKENTKERKEEE